MSRHVHHDTALPEGQAQTATIAIRQSIAHFFGNDKDGAMISRIADHTLRDIGVDPTVYDYL